MIELVLECLGRETALGTRAVVKHELLAKSLREPLTNQACGNVEGAARRECEEDAQAFCRMDLPSLDR